MLGDGWVYEESPTDLWYVDYRFVVPCLPTSAPPLVGAPVEGRFCPELGKSVVKVCKQMPLRGQQCCEQHHHYGAFKESEVKAAAPRATRSNTILVDHFSKVVAGESESESESAGESESEGESESGSEGEGEGGSGGKAARYTVGAILKKKGDLMVRALCDCNLSVPRHQVFCQVAQFPKLR